MDKVCVFEGFTSLRRKTFLAPVNIARCVQNANTNTTTAMCTGFLKFCRIFSKTLIR